MSEPYIGQISMFSFGFAPTGWATCDGQIIRISQNQALFSLLSNIYGGDGITTFALPDLRGRTPVHLGPINRQGARVGEEAHTLVPAEIPMHRHTMMASGAAANAPVAQGNVLAVSANNPYGPMAVLPPSLVHLNPGTIAPAGGSAHENMQPFLTISFCIALAGVFPPRS